MPSSAAAPRRWAVIAISASAAAIRPSRSTHVATGTARSARGTRVPSGWRRARLNCCPSRTFTSSSRCRMSFLLLSCRTSSCFTICSTEPALPRCSNWLAIPGFWEPTSDSSACSIHGGRTSSRTLTQDARHYHLLRFQRIGWAGLPRDPLLELACPCGEACRGCSVLFRYSNRHGKSPKEHEE